MQPTADDVISIHDVDAVVSTIANNNGARFSLTF